MHVVYVCVCLKAGFIILSSCEKLDCEIQQMVAELREVLDSREAVSNTTLENFTIYFEQFTAHTHVHARMHTHTHTHTHTRTLTRTRTHTHTHTHTGPSLFYQAEKRPKTAATGRAERKPQQDGGGGKPGPRVAATSKPRFAV